MGDLVLGLDLGGTTMLAGVADPTGRLLDTQTLPTRAELGADQAVERVLAAGDSLVRRCGGRLRGVGVASMGVTYEDRVALAPNVPGWERLRLPGLVRDRFGVPVRVDNDVKAAALAEVSQGALRGVRYGLYLNLGTGIAAAATLDGAVVGGAHGAAGEIGYAPRTPDEQYGAREGRVPLEEYVGGRAISDAYEARFGEPVSTAELCRRAVDGDPRAGDFLRPRLDAIAFQLANLAIAADPERIAVGGGLARSESLLFPVLRARLEAFVPFPPEVVAARFDEQAGLVGATVLARQAGSGGPTG